MDSDTAQWVLNSIVLAASLVWLLALWFVVNTFRSQAASPSEAALGTTKIAKPILLCGDAQLAGDRETLSQRIAQVLGAATNPTIGPVTIHKRSERLVQFSNSARAVVGFFEGQVNLAGVGGKVRLTWQVVLEGRKGLAIAAVVCLVLGLCVIILGAWTISTYIVHHPQPAVRYQTFQMLQVVHFLWLPFLFAGIQRRIVRMLREYLETLVHNLPHSLP